ACQVLGIQAAGVEDDAAPETSLARMASRYVTALRARAPEGPYLLGGWSMGGVIAFEMARQLVEAGQDAPWVFMVDCSVPTRQHTAPPADDDQSLLDFAADLARTAGPDSWPALALFRDRDLNSLKSEAVDRSLLTREIAREIGPDRLRRLHGV